VICPGGSSSCPDGDTCCVIGGGCCPGLNSACCANNKCCPQGNLCCPTGCCPSSYPVCCANNRCCPEGTQCGADNKCYAVSGGNTYPALLGLSQVSKKKSVVPRNATKVQNVVCPGSAEECLDGNTCCLTLAGNYGCCPDANAVCCADLKSCCPHNTKCGKPGDDHCYLSGQAPRKTMEMTAAKQKKVSSSSIICPGGGSCPDGNTCCPGGCCPQANANCCSDGQHCCPGGYTCGPDKCYASSSSHPLLMLKTQ